MRFITPLLMLMLSACATMPTGPSVNVLPAPGKQFDVFAKEDGTCKQWAQSQIGNSTQETYDKSAVTGAVAGTAIGAGLGAAVGSASGHAGAGAGIGAATGLLFGSVIGSENGQVSSREVQRRYDNAYMQCMYSYGNQVPGYRPVQPRPVVAVPPPPPPPVAQAAPMPSGDVPPDAVAPPDNTPPPAPPDVAPPQYAQPAPVYVQQAPQFVYSPQIGMYVAVGVPYDLVYTGSEYFYYYGGYWYRGPYYNGPWVFATRAYFPPALLRFNIGYIRYYRDYEFRQWRLHGRGYRGRFHTPEYRR
jgi:hypothetical protein